MYESGHTKISVLFSVKEEVAFSFTEKKHSILMSTQTKLLCSCHQIQGSQMKSHDYFLSYPSSLSCDPDDPSLPQMFPSSQFYGIIMLSKFPLYSVVRVILLFSLLW